MIWAELAPYADVFTVLVAVALIALLLALGGLVAGWLFPERTCFVCGTARVARWHRAGCTHPGIARPW